MRPLTPWLRLCGIVVLLLSCSGRIPAPPGPPAAGGGYVRGFVLARLVDMPAGGPVVPDIEVFLRYQGTGTDTPSTTSDLDGRYVVRPHHAGTYLLCWRGEGWLAACLTEPLALTGGRPISRRIDVAPVLGTDRSGRAVGVVLGRVTQADGSSCQFSNPFFRGDFTARVTALDAGNRALAGRVRANRGGAYVLPGVPIADVRVRAGCESATAERSVRAGEFIGRGTAVADLTIPNTPPEIRGMVASRGRRAISRAALGETIAVEAALLDRDGDRLDVRWIVSEAGGAVRPGAGATARWTVPRSRGTHSLYVVASDGRGGVARSRISLEVGAEGVFFSGLVTSDGSAALADARVRVNGTAVTTDASGAFAALVPEDPGDRYVVSVTKPGHVVRSRVFRNGATGTRWHLARARVVTIDPQRPITVVDPSGLSIDIPRNALVDERGRPATGPLRLALAALDQTKDPLPGDYSAVDRAGVTRHLDAFGAAFLDVRDAAGNRYDLAPGQRARLRIPIFRPGLQSLPRDAVAVAYDAISGYWRDRGTARRDGPFYALDIDGFPDALAGGLMADPGCLLVFADATVPAGKTVLRVTGPGQQVTDVFLTGTSDLGPPYLALYLVTPLWTGTSPQVTLQLVDFLAQKLPAEFIDGNTGTPLPDDKVISGQLILPPSPYYCTQPVMVSLSSRLRRELPEAAFLSQTLWQLAPADEPQVYAGLVDPQSNRQTLGAWWTTNGFGADGSTGAGGTRAAYLNNNDYGVGRDVRCRTFNGADVACYATHYGPPNQSPGNAQLAQQAVVEPALKSQASMTLAMEFRAIEGQDPSQRIVKFFAFQGGEASGPWLNTVDIDGFGEKPVPRVCAVCHGTVYPHLADFSPGGFLYKLITEGHIVDLGSSFREFDVAALVPAGAQSFSPLAHVNFHALNQLVKQTNPAAPITPLIDGWYSGGTTIQLDPFVPGAPYSWQGSAAQENLYTNVVAKSCRGCHLALRNDDFVSWKVPGEFIPNGAFIHNFVCGPSKSMPGAFITFLNYWLSANPHRPQVLKDFFAMQMPPTPYSCP